MSKVSASSIKKVFNMDGWLNILSGLGTSKDSRTSSIVTWNKMTETDLENLYAGAKIAQKIVDLPVKKAMENGYHFTGIDSEQEVLLKKELQKLYVNETLIEAAIKARVYGGSVILKIYDDSLELEKPIELYTKKLKKLLVLQRFELLANYEDIQKDIFSEEFGCPIKYTFYGTDTSNAQYIKIHYSRVCRFDGQFLPDKLRQQNGYWHDSILGPLYESIRNYYDAHDGVSASLKDISVGKFKIKGLSDLVTADCDDKIIKRLELVNMSKSIIKAIVLDSEGEDFSYEVRNMSGVKDILGKVEDKLAAESQIPSTVLFGHSPSGGLGQTGDHDTANWFSYVRSIQENMIKGPLLEISKEICNEIGIPHEELDVEFEPLDVESDETKVAYREKQANIDEKYINMGVIDPSEVRDSRFGNQEYTIETKIDESIDMSAARFEEDLNLIKQEEAAKLKNQAANSNTNEETEGENE